ncbi:MAG: PhoU domain-containing protein [Planctomycetota bacterium]
MTDGADFASRVNELTGAIADQGRRVQELVEQAFESVFAADQGVPERVEALDDVIDERDVWIEQQAVALLDDATRVGEALGLGHLRTVLTVVKVNNEYERAADAGVDVASHIGELAEAKVTPPPTFRVMTNSLLGILRDTCDAYEKGDAELARIVLGSEDTVETFKTAVLRELEQRVAEGSLSPDNARVLHELVYDSFRIADYCSNVAEQVIYQQTGCVVRHTDAGWVDNPPKPQAEQND